MDLQAIVLVDPATADVRIAGMTVRERAERVARRAGARDVVLAPVTGTRDVRASARMLLVIRADQLVHPPLVAPLLAAPPPNGIAIATDPDGTYAGAVLATGDAVARVVAMLAHGDRDDAITAGADTRVVVTGVAHHAVGTPAERAAAQQLLFTILVKPQDNVITRYLFRPVSSRITRVLVHTPATATQVSIVVAILVGLGCWMTLDPRPSMLIAGALTILWASYLDCCDGEIARVKLQASTFGAWLDTIVDELSSIAYMVCIGWHCHAYFGRDYFGDLGYDPWLVAIVVGLATYLWTLYCIYYNIIVGVGSANSQDYTSRFVVVPGTQPDRVRFAPKPPGPRRALPPWLRRLVDFWPNLARRDFIVWLAAGYAIARLPLVSFATHVAGGLVSSTVCTIDHLHLRRLRATVRRSGKTLERPKR